LTARVLLVDDEPNQLVTIGRILRREGYEVSIAQNGEEALAQLRAAPADVVITDLNMPVLDGMSLLRGLEGLPSRPATVVLTGYGTIQSAVEAMKLGAADYLIKPCNPDELKLVIQRQLEVHALRREVETLRREVQRHQRFGALIGQSNAMQEVYRLIETVSRNKSTVLLSGESGTGKELVARTLHQRSPWSKGPFLALNCGAVSETLLDSQLFGHRRGAFTGATSDQEGVFQAANGGTLFLDEISEIPLPLQVKFLRAIQEREITPLGTTRAVKVDVRIVAATNRDLREEVRRGLFREDLFYRLNVINIHLPALRERLGDLDVLIEHFLAAFAESYHVAPKRLAPEARQRLHQHDWPGNVRELQNVIERAFAISADDTIVLADVAPALQTSDASAALPRVHEGMPVEPVPFASTPLPERDDAVLSLEEAERRAIAAAMSQAAGNKNEAARLLKIDRQRLYRKLDKYELR
jgi:two-component system, NtrC family, response regulator